MGWLADRRVPRPLRGALYGAYCRITGADPLEAEFGLRDYPSLGAFFVRRLRRGARTLDPDPSALLSPCDGTVQAIGRIERGTLLQAKGQSYSLRELLGGAEGVEDLEGAWTATIYLSPRNYHRVHAPLGARLAEVRWLGGLRRSVAPEVLERTPRVLCANERAVLTLEGAALRAHLVMVGALNVSRIRVVGVEPGGECPAEARFERGEELARFELGSTVVLVVPGACGGEWPRAGDAVRLGQRLATLP
jgi:phosphatidylserine decarboxylase